MLSISQNVSKCIRNTVFSSNGRIASLQFNKFHTIHGLYCENKSLSTEDQTVEGNIEEPSPVVEEKKSDKDRTRLIPVETSIRYLKSFAYKQTYGNHLVWEEYRRNHKGLLPPKKTRKTCIRKGCISTGNPCPICRDEYLVLDHRNIELLNQFISPQTGEVLSYSKTGLCQKKHLELLVSVERAKDLGLITFDVPIREFDYSEYYKKQTSGKQG